MDFKNIISFDEISSTNTYLKENYNKLDNYTVVTSRHQTNGRGRQSRTWVDGDDLLMSVLIKDKFKISDLSKLSILVSTALYASINKITDASIKWPNDIILNNKKLAGILIESVINSGVLKCVVIGIGLNVNTTKYKDELIDIATSLKLATSTTYIIDELRDMVLESLKVYLEDFLNGSTAYLDTYRLANPMIGKVISFKSSNNTYQARVVDVLENGNIQLLFKGKLMDFSSGEISLEDNYKTLGKT